ncbi:hypothetical protein ACFL35_10800 [Candidatus Riflebacteria bacterium]
MNRFKSSFVFFPRNLKKEEIWQCGTPGKSLFKLRKLSIKTIPFLIVSPFTFLYCLEKNELKAWLDSILWKKGSSRFQNNPADAAEKIQDLLRSIILPDEVVALLHMEYRGIFKATTHKTPPVLLTPSIPGSINIKMQELESLNFLKCLATSEDEFMEKLKITWAEFFTSQFIRAIRTAFYNIDEIPVSVLVRKFGSYEISGRVVFETKPESKLTIYSFLGQDFQRLQKVGEVEHKGDKVGLKGDECDRYEFFPATGIWKKKICPKISRAIVDYKQREVKSCTLKNPGQIVETLTEQTLDEIKQICQQILQIQKDGFNFYFSQHLQYLFLWEFVGN